MVYYKLASAHTDFAKIKSILYLILPFGFIKLTPEGVIHELYVCVYIYIYILSYNY